MLARVMADHFLAEVANQGDRVLTIQIRFGLLAPNTEIVPAAIETPANLDLKGGRGAALFPSRASVSPQVLSLEHLIECSLSSVAISELGARQTEPMARPSVR